MSLFIYITPQCKKDAQLHGVESSLTRLANNLQREQRLWGLQGFSYPYFVKKQFGRAHLRLICRREQMTIDRYTIDVLILITILQRKEDKYTEFYTHSRAVGDQLTAQYVDFTELKTYLTQVLTLKPAPSLPLPTQTEHALLFAANHQLTQAPNLHLTVQIEQVYESWQWTDAILRAPPELTERLFNRIEQYIQAIQGLAVSSAEPLSLYASILLTTQNAPGKTYWLAFYNPSYQAYWLDIQVIYDLNHETQNLSQQQPHFPIILNHSVLEIIQDKSSYTDTPLPVLHLISDHALLAFDVEEWPHYARRVYSSLLWLDRVKWQATVYNAYANVMCSPEEQDIFFKIETDGQTFPLFINGRAGSGKSFMLQRLFSHYLYYILTTQQQTSIPALDIAYFTYESRLTRRALNIVHDLLKDHGSHHALPATLLEHISSYFHDFKHYLCQLLSEQERQEQFHPTHYVDYARFEKLWSAKFKHVAEAQKKYPPALCWYIVRTFIKGQRDEQWFTPDDYRELDEAKRTISQEDFELIYTVVWEDWYSDKSKSLWDNQDLAYHVLEQQSVKPRFAAIFCDEAQDFTYLEFKIILKLCVFIERTVAPEHIARIPLVFAGDPYQTLNPTGFQWASIKAQVNDEFLFVLNPKPYATNTRLHYQELTYNFRSTLSIIGLANMVHVIHANVLDTRPNKPQRPYIDHITRQTERAVTYLAITDHEAMLQLAQQRDWVIIVPCLPQQEAKFLEQYRALGVYFKPTASHAQALLSLPVLSVISAKGLEFSRVILLGFAQTQPPLLLNEPNPLGLFKAHFSLEMEYFLTRLYVGVTRASEQLLILEHADDLTRFWHAFSQPFAAPLNLHEWCYFTPEWREVMQPIRAATLEDLVANPDEIRTLQTTAHALSEQGIDTKNAALLMQAAYLYEQLNDLGKSAYLRAQAAYFDNNSLEAGHAYADAAAQDLTQPSLYWGAAFYQFWHGQHWKEAQQLIMQPMAADVFKPWLGELLTLLVQSITAPKLTQADRRLNSKQATLTVYTHALQALLIVLQQATLLQAPLDIHLFIQEKFIAAMLAVLSTATDAPIIWKQPLYAAVLLLLENIPTAGVFPVEQWQALYSGLKRLTHYYEFNQRLSPMLLAHFAFKAEQFNDAYDYWSQNHAQAIQLKPSPDFAHAMRVALAFPDNLPALMALQDKKGIVQAFEHYTAVNTLTLEHWRDILPILAEQGALNRLRQVLPMIENRNVLQYIDRAITSQYANLAPLKKRIQQVNLYLAALEGDWPVILEALQSFNQKQERSQMAEPDPAFAKFLTAIRTAPKKAKKPVAALKITPTLSCMLNGLARSEALAELARQDAALRQADLALIEQPLKNGLGNRLKTELSGPPDDATSPTKAATQPATLQQLQQAMLGIFQYSQEAVSSDTRPSNKTYVPKLYWHLPPDEIKNIGAILERLQDLPNAIDYYEYLAQHLPAFASYAQSRLWVCKQHVLQKNRHIIETLNQFIQTSELSKKDLMNLELKLEHYKTEQQRLEQTLTKLRKALPEIPSEYPILPAFDELKQTLWPEQTVTKKSTKAPAKLSDIAPIELSQSSVISEPAPKPETHELVLATSTCEPSLQPDEPLQPQLNTIIQSDKTEPLMIVSIDDNVPNPQDMSFKNTDFENTEFQDVSLNETVLPPEPVCAESTQNIFNTMAQTAINAPSGMPSEAVEALAPDIKTVVSSQDSLNLPKLAIFTHHATRLPQSRFNIMDYQFAMLRAQQRLNIEHLLTGERISLFLDRQCATGDWQLQANGLGAFNILGTPLLVTWGDGPALYCSIDWPELGMQLKLIC